MINPFGIFDLILTVVEVLAGIFGRKNRQKPTEVRRDRAAFGFAYALLWLISIVALVVVIRRLYF